MTAAAGLWKSKARWFMLIALFRVVAASGYEILSQRLNREWITITLPDPPAPMPYDVVPATQVGGEPNTVSPN